MRTIKLVVSYDGSAYHGFQKQKNTVTVQSVLEEMLAKLCGERVVTAGSGRTDAGVHALAQTITFTTNGRIPCANILRASRTMLPRDIVLLDAQEVEEGFHARFSACWKIYQYKLLCSDYDDPFRARYAWQLRERLEVEAMNEAAAFLCGTHDFSAFRSTGSVEGSAVKTIYEAYWQRQGRELVFRIAGDGFLYHMVRNIVWALVQVGLGKRAPSDIAAELLTQRGTVLNEPAPPEGLYLEQVFYDKYAFMETERLYLRRLNRGDFAQLRRFLQDAEVMYAWEHAFSDDEVSVWLEENLRRYADDGFSFLAVIEKQSGRFLGVAGPLMEHIDGVKVPGIAYILAKEYWGQGFAKEAAQVSADYLRSLGYERVVAEIRPENEASLRVARALGMRRYGSFIKKYHGREIMHDLYYTGAAFTEKV